jgi:MAX-like protein X
MISEIDESSEAEVIKEPQIHEDYDQQEIIPNEIDNQNLDDLEAREVKAEWVYGDAEHPRTVAIDTSLSKLLQCMSIAYSGKLTSPKWKSFKGLRLKIKDKVRLNNIIWRCWHMQYIQGKKPPVCQFATTVDVHNKPEAVLLEGKYWKRGTETVTAEYNKWRKYHKEKHSSSLSVSIFLPSLL